MIDSNAIRKAGNRMRGRRNHALGDQGQVIAKYALERAGFALVEQVHTPWRIQRNAAGRICSATPVAKVSGDLRAVGPGGVSVLAEVKARPGRLIWSDLAAHQVVALDAHHQAGGLSFLIWVDGTTAHVLRWPVAAFGPRGSITIDGLTERMAAWKP